MVAVAALAAALSVWVWAAPGAAAVRLAELIGTRSRRPRPRLLPERPRPAAKAAAWRAASIELCQIIVAELAAGKTPGDALARAVLSVSAPDPAVLAPVAAIARDGGDVSAALLRAAPALGGEGLVRLAACWRVSVTVGGGLAALVERVGGSLREAEAHRQDLAAQLAGPRATARMLAGLPVLGLLMGAGLGMNPLSFLLGGPAGFACLVVGLSLNATGVWWTNRLVARAEGSPVTQEPATQGPTTRGQGP